MGKTSAGIVLYRTNNEKLEVFLIHPGGPFWAKKDDGVWSIPKGEYENGEDPLDAARREFEEETGFACIDGDVQTLGAVKLNSGKVVSAWAIEGDCNPAHLRSNLFELEWPPKSGRIAQFPEVDRGGWFDREQALRKITKGQRPVIEKFYIDLQDPSHKPTAN